MTASTIRDRIVNNIQHIQALFIYKNDHYFCVRQFDKTLDYFFIIDSLHPHGHNKIKKSRIHEYIEYLYDNNSSVYVPVCANMLQSEISFNGFNTCIASSITNM